MFGIGRQWASDGLVWIEMPKLMSFLHFSSSVIWPSDYEELLLCIEGLESWLTSLGGIGFGSELTDSLPFLMFINNIKKGFRCGRLIMCRWEGLGLACAHCKQVSSMVLVREAESWRGERVSKDMAPHQRPQWAPCAGHGADALGENENEPGISQELYKNTHSHIQGQQTSTQYSNLENLIGRTKIMKTFLDVCVFSWVRSFLLQPLKSETTQHLELKNVGGQQGSIGKKKNIDNLQIKRKRERVMRVSRFSNN